MWKNILSRKDEDRGNVPIQNPSVFIKDNDDWVGVRSFSEVQGNPLFMEWRERSSNILKMGEARLYKLFELVHFGASTVDDSMAVPGTVLKNQWVKIPQTG